MQIERIILRQVRLPYLHFFETSFGRSYEKQAVLVEVRADGLHGWGECVAGERPDYSAEDVQTAWHILRKYMGPVALGKSLDLLDRFEETFAWIRGHAMAKASLESALWDLKSKALNLPLWKALGGTRSQIPCGVSIGIQDEPKRLLERISLELEAGYQRIKIKIRPGWDLGILQTVRHHFPTVPLMVDANSAYTPSDRELLKEFDQFGLLMIEQPLYCDDLLEHARLQSHLETPLCLDESIRHLRDARAALQLGACRVVNIKAGRVGGLAEAIRIHDLCSDAGIPVWCGGMLETGIGRAHNVALSTLANFRMPGDVSASARYFERDTVRPPIEVSPEGFIVPSSKPGIGHEPDLEWIENITVRSESLS